MVSIKTAIFKASELLDKNSVPSPLREAQILLGGILGKDMIYLKIHSDEILPDEIYNDYLSKTKQRAKGKPMAYITGKKEFMSLEFVVNEDVLIPRPETEELCELIIEYASDRKAELLDLCTGSGAIALSIANYCRNLSAVGVDISDGALLVARKNAERLKLSDRVTFLKHDVIKGLEGHKFDIAVSNPPYIERNEVLKLEPTVKDFEPFIALDGGDDGLDFYRAIIKNIDSCLKKEGMLFLEIGYNQAEALASLMKDKFTNIKIIKDLSGHNRIVTAQLA